MIGKADTKEPDSEAVVRYTRVEDGFYRIEWADGEPDESVDPVRD